MGGGGSSFYQVLHGLHAPCLFWCGPSSRVASGLADDADIPTADRTHQLLAIQNAVVISRTSHRCRHIIFLHAQIVDTINRHVLLLRFSGTCVTGPLLPQYHNPPSPTPHAGEGAVGGMWHWEAVGHWGENHILSISICILQLMIMYGGWMAQGVGFWSQTGCSGAWVRVK